VGAAAAEASFASPGARRLGADDGGDAASDGADFAGGWVIASRYAAQTGPGTDVGVASVVAKSVVAKAAGDGAVVARADGGGSAKPA
jgi:hypothetical protein